MPGIDPSIIVHKLNVSPSSPPIRQRKRVFIQEIDKAIAEKVQKLLDADFIREVYYPDVHEIYTINYSHIYIFRFTFMLFCD